MRGKSDRSILGITNARQKRYIDLAVANPGDNRV